MQIYDFSGLSILSVDVIAVFVDKIYGAATIYEIRIVG